MTKKINNKAYLGISNVDVTMNLGLHTKMLATSARYNELFSEENSQYTIRFLFLDSSSGNRGM